MGRAIGGVRALFVIVGLAATGMAAAPAAHAVTVPAGVVCSTYDAATSEATLRLGSRNPDKSIETIPVGENNFFFPSVEDRGQPAQFIPGLQSWDLTVPANDQDLYWGLNNQYLDLRPYRDPEALPFERPCPERGPQITSVVPTALRAGVDDQRVTIFGQGLAGSTANVTGAGISADAVADSSDQRLDVIVDVGAGASTDPRDLLVSDPQSRQTGCRHCLALDAPAPAQGPVGPAGPAGPEGPVGPAGPPGPSGVDGADGVAVSPDPAVDHATSAPARFRRGKATATAICPDGRSVVSGGHDVARASGISVLADRPTEAGAWQVSVRAESAHADARLRVFATCL